MTQFNPSPQQSAFGDAIRVAQNNIILEAVAGSGKTTTIVWATTLIPIRLPGAFLPQNIVFLAFNKAIAETLAARCPGHVQCCTFHSLGFRALKEILGPRTKVESRKCSKLLYTFMNSKDPDFQNVLRLTSLLKAVGFGCLPCGTANDIFDRFELNAGSQQKVVDNAQRLLDRSNVLTAEIDFDDMLYLAVLLNAPFQKRDWVFVDEAQDTNEIQVEILDHLMKPKQCPYKCLAKPVEEFDQTFFCPTCDFESKSPTRLIAVGDPYQSIYGFRGANSDAMSRIATRFNCVPMPLSVSFRCPHAIINEVQSALERFK